MAVFQYVTGRLWKIFYLAIFQKRSLYHEKLINQMLQKELILHLIPLLDITHINSTKCSVCRYDLLLVKLWRIHARCFNRILPFAG